MTTHDPFNDRKLTRYDFDEAYVESCLDQIAYESQQIVDAEERMRKLRQKWGRNGDLGGVDAATDDEGLPNLNPTMKGWLDEVGQ